jgi:hypothetical protein
MKLGKHIYDIRDYPTVVFLLRIFEVEAATAQFSRES